MVKMFSTPGPRCFAIQNFQKSVLFETDNEPE
jgi:hypothetical protein